MNAVRFHQHGGPEVLRYEDAPDPVPAPGEALVRVRACALNHLDLWQRRGLPRVTFPLPHISGSDVAGEVVTSPTPDVPTGSRVMLQPGLSCGRCEACLSGRDNECPQYEVLGYRNHDGGYAELVKVPLQNLVKIPDHVDFTQAAAFPLTFLTAWHMLLTRARPQERRRRAGAGGGERGRSGGDSDRAPAWRAGLATAGSDEKLERAREIGANDVIHHHKQDIVEEIQRFTDRRGVDIVIEHVGEATWPKSVRVARPWRPSRDVRVDHRRERRHRSDGAVREATVDSWLLYGHEG